MFEYHLLLPEHWEHHIIPAIEKEEDRLALAVTCKGMWARMLPHIQGSARLRSLYKCLLSATSDLNDRKAIRSRFRALWRHIGLQRLMDWWHPELSVTLYHFKVPNETFTFERDCSEIPEFAGRHDDGFRAAICDECYGQSFAFILVNYRVCPSSRLHCMVRKRCLSIMDDGDQIPGQLKAFLSSVEEEEEEHERRRRRKSEES